MKPIWQAALLAVILTLVSSNTIPTSNFSSSSSGSDMTSVSSVEWSSTASNESLYSDVSNESSSSDVSTVSTGLLSSTASSLTASSTSSLVVSTESPPADVTPNATSATGNYSNVWLEGSQSWIKVVVGLTIFAVCTSAIVICCIASRKYWCRKRSASDQTPSKTPTSPTERAIAMLKKNSVLGIRKSPFPVKPDKKMVDQLKESVKKTVEQPKEPDKKMIEQLKETGSEDSKKLGSDESKTLNRDDSKKLGDDLKKATESGVQASVFGATTNPVSALKTKQNAVGSPKKNFPK